MDNQPVGQVSGTGVPRIGAREPQAAAANRGALGGRRVSVRTHPAQQGICVRARQQEARNREDFGEPPSLLNRVISALRSSFGTFEPVRTPERAPPGRAGGQQTVAGEAGTGARETLTEPGAPTGRNEAPVAQRLEEILANGEVEKLGNYLANHSIDGGIAQSAGADLGRVIDLSSQLDADIGRAEQLLQESGTNALNEAERLELSTLVRSNKYNLVVLQNWLGTRMADLEADGELSPQAETLFQALRLRCADRHMHLADLICLHALDEKLDEPVNRGARAAAYLLHADAALNVARDLNPPGLDPAARQRLIGDLQAHRDQLTRIGDVANGRIEAPSRELRLASKELWDTPMPLVGFNKARSGSIAALRAQWSTGARDNSRAPPLPVAHPGIGQARLLQEFINHRLTEAGVARRDMPDLKAAQADAYIKVINGQPWEPIAKRVVTTLPDSHGGTTKVESQIVPGKAMAAHFAEDYLANGINSADRTQYKHVPNLARTSLTNSSGKTLFAGLRHGVIDPYEIDARHLARQSDDQLRTMIGDLLIRENAADPARGSREQQIENRLVRIRTSPTHAARAAEDMRAQAGREMARELVAAALVSDPAKFQNALAGAAVDIDLSSISLLTPDSMMGRLGKSTSDERTMLRHQQDALAELGRDGPLALTVRDGTGRRHTVRANVKVRQFNFGVNFGAVEGVPLFRPHRSGMKNLAGWGFAMERNDPHLNRLLGSAGEPGVGGDVRARIRSLQAEDAELRRVELDLLPRLDVDDADLAAARRARYFDLLQQMDEIGKQARALEEAGTQLKTIWANEEYSRGGGDPYKMVSRLALVSQLMGETPLFNCKSGKDRTGQLDAEVKFLATVADEQAGTLPPVDQDMARWRSARSDFTLNTGNFEMQQLNTGLPGYKLGKVSGLDNMIAEGMRPVYRGGSHYISF